MKRRRLGTPHLPTGSMPLDDQELRAAAGGLVAVSTIAFPVIYANVGSRPRVATLADPAFDFNLHGWGHHH